MSTFRISNYRAVALRFALNCFELLALIGIITTLFVVSVVNALPSQPASLARPALIVLVIFVVGFIILLPQMYLLSYRVIVSDDGQITEKQMFRPLRAIRAQDVASAKWEYIGTAQYGFGWLSRTATRHFQSEITQAADAMSSQVGIKDMQSFGLELTNPTYPSFPKYPVSGDFVTAFKTIRPDMAIEGFSDEQLSSIHHVRGTLPAIFSYSLGIVFIVGGLVMAYSLGAGAYVLSWVFLPPGVLALILGWYLGKQK